jgi:hypothetical protein
MTNGIQVSGAAPASPHRDGLYEAGKKLLVDSVEVGRDFCKTMITVATGAIPIYIALIGFVVGKDFRPSFGQGAVLVLAPGALLLSAVAFAIGYFPKSSTFSLDAPAETEEARTSTLNKRLLWSKIGFGLLVAGIVLAITAILYALTIEVPVAPQEKTVYLT